MKLKRFIAFMIDVAIAALIAIIANSILFIFDVRVITPMMGAAAWAILFCKDCFNGTSVGKYIVGIQVVNSDNNEILSPTKCVIRNLFYFLTFIEAIVMYYGSKGLRVGDYATHAKVVKYDKTLQKTQFKQSIIAIGYVLLGLMLYELFIYYRASSYGLL